MDTEKCGIILSILKCGSLSAAAEELGYTPSGISRAVDAMEKETGFAILRRDRKGAQLTHEGEELLPVIKELAYWGEQYRQTAGKIRGGCIGKVFVGTAYIKYYARLSRIIADFHEAYPGISVQIIEGTSSELNARMDERALDFAIISRREGRHRWLGLTEDWLRVLLPAEHPMAKCGKFPIEALDKETYIEILPGMETDNSLMLAEYGVKPKIGFTTTDSFAAYAMVRAGLGVSIVNGIIAGDLPRGVACVPLAPKKLIEIGIILPEEGTISPAAKRFAEFAIKGLRSSGK